MSYRTCEGCYARIRQSDIKYVKEYMDGDNLMSPQWLCIVCCDKFMQSYSEMKSVSLDKEHTDTA